MASQFVGGAVYVLSATSGNGYIGLFAWLCVQAPDQGSAGVQLIPITSNAPPYQPGSNLDIGLTLFDSTTGHPTGSLTGGSWPESSIIEYEGKNWRIRMGLNQGDPTAPTYLIIEDEAGRLVCAQTNRCTMLKLASTPSAP